MRWVGGSLLARESKQNEEKEKEKEKHKDKDKDKDTVQDTDKG